MSTLYWWQGNLCPSAISWSLALEKSKYFALVCCTYIITKFLDVHSWSTMMMHSPLLSQYVCNCQCSCKDNSTTEKLRSLVIHSNFLHAQIGVVTMSWVGMSTIKDIMPTEICLVYSKGLRAQFPSWQNNLVWEKKHQLVDIVLQPSSKTLLND